MSDGKRSRKEWIIIALVILAVVSVKFFTQDVWDINASKLKNEINRLDKSVEIINLQQLTPFEWDVAYSFSPYISSEVVYDVVGYEWKRINDKLNESLHQIVFLKDGRVVCYIDGFTYEDGFRMSFNKQYTNAGVEHVSTISIEDRQDFKVERKDSMVYFIRIVEN